MGSGHVGRRVWQHSMMTSLQSLIAPKGQQQPCNAALMLLRTLHMAPIPKASMQPVAMGWCGMSRRQPQCRAQLMQELLQRDLWHSCPQRTLWHIRHNSSGSSTTSKGNSWWASISQQVSAFQMPVIDAHEAMLLRTFGSAKEAIGLYCKPRPWQGQVWVAFTDRLDSFWNRSEAWWACFRSISGFSKRALLEEACAAYKSVNLAVASKDAAKIDAIKHLLTPTAHQKLRAEAVQASRLPVTVHWKLQDMVEAEVVDGAVERLIPERLLRDRPSKLHVAQFTVRFLTSQRYWTTDAHGKVLMGDPHKPQLVEEYWVFERPFYKSLFIRKAAPPQATWKLVEQLDYEAVVNPSPELREATIRAGAKRSLYAVMFLGFPLVIFWAISSVLLPFMFPTK